MKKILLFFTAALLFTSCFKDGTTYEATYTYMATFDNFSNETEIFPEGKNVYLFPVSETSTTMEGAIAIGDIIYYSKGDENYLQGGFAMSRQAWKYPSPDEGTGEDGDGSDSGSSETGDPTPANMPYGSYAAEGEGGAPENSSAKGSKTFLYFRQSGAMPEHDIQFNKAAYGTCTPTSISVNNSASTVYAILGQNGDAFNLASDDDFKLIITGYLNGTKTGSKEVLLAGKGKSKVPGVGGTLRDSIITSWTTVDLKDLNSIEYIELELTGGSSLSELNSVCLDNFTSSVHIKI